MKKTKIIATIGPETQDIEVLRQMILNGMDVARLNLTHATHEFCIDILKKIEILNKELKTNVATLLDTSGPDIRTHRFIGGHAFLHKGDKIRIYMTEIMGDSTKFSINYNLLDDVRLQTIIKLNDGLISLEVVSKGTNYLICEVLEEGMISDCKSVNVPGIRFDRNFLSDKDRLDIELATKYRFDFLALSFVSTSEDVLEVSDLLIRQGNNHTLIISKIECQNAIEEIDEIIKVSDGVMIARGDLGVELKMEEVPALQKQIARKAHLEGKICIVATEMLASMENVTRPTRAEVSDVANAVIDGVDAVMLSGETTTGKYPIETVQMMKRIVIATENSIDYLSLLDKASKTRLNDITGTIAYTVAESAGSLDCAAIITPTITGYTAREISRFRPSCPIIAVSPNEETVKLLALNFGVIPVLIDELNSLDKIIVKSTNAAKKILNLQEGDKVVITGGYPFKESKHTNFMKIEEL